MIPREGAFWRSTLGPTSGSLGVLSLSSSSRDDTQVEEPQDVGRWKLLGREGLRWSVFDFGVCAVASLQAWPLVNWLTVPPSHLYPKPLHRSSFSPPAPFPPALSMMVTPLLSSSNFLFLPHPWPL